MGIAPIRPTHRASHDAFEPTDARCESGPQHDCVYAVGRQSKDLNVSHDETPGVAGRACGDGRHGDLLTGAVGPAAARGGRSGFATCEAREAVARAGDGCPGQPPAGPGVATRAGASEYCTRSAVSRFALAEPPSPRSGSGANPAAQAGADDHHSGRDPEWRRHSQEFGANGRSTLKGPIAGDLRDAIPCRPCGHVSGKLAAVGGAMLAR